MFKRQIKNAKDRQLVDFFKKPVNPRHRQYEAIRAIVMDKEAVEEVAEKFNYRESTLYALLRESKSGRIDLFPMPPRKKKTGKITGFLKAEVVKLRDAGLSAKNIREAFAEKEVEVSLRTVERLLSELGFPKLPRRTNKQLGITRKKYNDPGNNGKT
jgi:transposase